MENLHTVDISSTIYLPFLVIVVNERPLLNCMSSSGRNAPLGSWRLMHLSSIEKDGGIGWPLQSLSSNLILLAKLSKD